jgi:hypothetical protein
MAQAFATRRLERVKFVMKGGVVVRNELAAEPQRTERAASSVRGAR